MIYVGTGPGYTYLVALISWDNGDTWSDLSKSDWTSTGYIYAVGGSAEITDDGYVIGSFTDQQGGDSGDPQFFKIPAYTETLTLDFGIDGVWLYDGENWRLVTNLDPEMMISWKNSLVMDFSSYGVYSFEGVDLILVNSLSPVDMAVWGDKIVLDYGNYGVYAFDGTSWAVISASSPENMTAIKLR